MIDKFRKDDYLFGALIGIVSTLITAGILLLGLAMFSKGFNDDPKIFMFSFIPAILLMRWYFKTKNIKTAKSIVLVIFIGFILLAFLLFRIGTFSNTHI